jgi:hypothetical protein
LQKDILISVNLLLIFDIGYSGVFILFLKLMKALIKVLIWIAWISSAIAVAFVILGIFQGFFGRMVHNTEIIKYFHVANSFFLLTIVSLLFLNLGKQNKD